jgi:predicted AAA+ superfamily ATPase
MINAGRNNLADYFLYMEEAGLIAQLRDDTGGIRGLGKVDKVYLDNTNLVYVLGEKEANIGNVRETFFFNQLKVNQDVMTSSVSDIQIGNRTFEVGCKKQKQLQGVDHGFVVKDDIETGYLNVIPLWMFGLNY